MKEEYRAVKGYEGLYEVSNLGNVKSIGYGKERVLKPSVSNRGYKHLQLWKNGVRENLRVNRLVAIAFIPNPNNLPFVNHKDENPSNNRLDNLEWCTPKYNSNYGTAIERTKLALKTNWKNPRAREVYCIELDKTYPNAKEAGLALGLDNSTISKICKGTRNVIHGYHFRYAD